MATAIERQIEQLDHMTTTELAERYAELHGQPTRTRHRAYLIRKIAWRIQANAEGGLSERARRRAAELADDADVRVMPPKAMATTPGGAGASTGRRVAPVRQNIDPRLPAPGNAITRKYKGRTIRVVVLPDGGGFECSGKRYRTLSAVAKAVTGSHMNGFRFFKLDKQA